jgi:hypothetical protein
MCGFLHREAAQGLFGKILIDEQIFAHTHFKVMPTSPGTPPGKSMICTLSL